MKSKAMIKLFKMCGNCGMLNECVANVVSKSYRLEYAILSAHPRQIIGNSNLTSQYNLYE